MDGARSVDSAAVVATFSAVAAAAPVVDVVAVVATVARTSVSLLRSPAICNKTKNIKYLLIAK